MDVDINVDRAGELSVARSEVCEYFSLEIRSVQ